MKTKMLKIAVATAFALPLGAQATLYQFNASLSGANERPSPIATSAFGLATLHYDDKGTAGSLLKSALESVCTTCTRGRSDRS